MYRLLQHGDLAAQSRGGRSMGAGLLARLCRNKPRAGNADESERGLRLRDVMGSVFEARPCCSLPRGVRKRVL